MTRHAAVQRETAETAVRVELTIAGSGEATVNTGVGMYDHLLTSLLHHGLFDAYFGPVWLGRFIEAKRRIVDSFGRLTRHAPQRSKRP